MAFKRSSWIDCILLKVVGLYEGNFIIYFTAFFKNELELMKSQNSKLRIWLMFAR